MIKTYFYFFNLTGWAKINRERIEVMLINSIIHSYYIDVTEGNDSSPQSGCSSM